jgi:hypothetical protein
LLRRVVWQEFTNVSEVLAASIIRATHRVFSSFFLTAMYVPKNRLGTVVERCNIRIPGSYKDDQAL